MWREWCVVICFCLSVSNEAASAHHKKQTNSTVATTPAVSGGNLSSTVQGWLLNYWYVLVVVLLVLMVTSIFACACVVKKARRNPTHYQVDATSTRSVPPLTHPFSRPPLSSVVDGSLSPGMVSMDRSPVPSPQPSYSSQQSQRSSGRSTTYKKKRTLSPGQNSSGSEETIRSDKGMLRVPWQQQMTPDSMMKLSISGMAQHNSTSLPEAISMLSVRSNHSGRSSHSARSGHTHSDALSQKAVVEVDVKLHLSPDQEQDARRMTAAALAESARQLARSAARLGEEEEPYQVFSHSPPRTYYQSRVASSQVMREPLPPQRDVSAGRVTMPLTTISLDRDRAVSTVTLDHPVYSLGVQRGRHGYLAPASPLTAHSPTKLSSSGLGSLDRPHPHSPTKLSSSGLGSLDRPHPHSPTKLSSSGLGSLDRPHPHSPTKLSSSGLGSLDRSHPHSPTKLSSSGLGSLDRPHPYSPGKGSNLGVGSLDRPHPHSPTRTLRPGVGSLDKVNRSSSGLQRARVPSVSSERSDRVPWRYGDARSHDPLRQFYEQDGHTSRTSQDTPPGYRQTGVGCRDYSTIDADGVDVDTIDMENVAATQHQNCSLGHHCCGDDVRLCTLPHHYITSASQDSRTPLSFGQLSHGVARSNHDSMQLHLQDRENVALETRVTKRQSESCAEDSGIQTTSFSEEHFHLPPSPCCSSSVPSVEEEPQVVHTETVVCEKQQSLSTAHQHTPPTSSHQMVALPRSNSGLSADEQLSTASGYAATGSASSIDTGSNGPPSQPNQFQLEPRMVRRTSHSGVTPCNLASPAGVHEWDPSSPDLTPREQSHGHDIVVPQSKGKGNHHSISSNWMQQPVIKYSNHGDQESISVDI